MRISEKYYDLTQILKRIKLKRVFAVHQCENCKDYMRFEYMWEYKKPYDDIYSRHYVCKKCATFKNNAFDLFKILGVIKNEN